MLLPHWLSITSPFFSLDHPKLRLCITWAKEPGRVRSRLPRADTDGLPSQYVCHSIWRGSLKLGITLLPWQQHSSMFPEQQQYNDFGGRQFFYPEFKGSPGGGVTIFIQKSAKKSTFDVTRGHQKYRNFKICSNSIV